MQAHETRAEDLAQATFLKAQEKLRSYRGNSTLRTWLFGIAYNLYREWLRNSKKAQQYAEKQREQESFGPTLEDEIGRQQLNKRLSIALDSLPPGQREALYLRDILGCSYADTAMILGISENAVKNRIYSARGNMQAKLSKRQRTDGTSL